MALELTNEERELVDQGKLDISKIGDYRKVFPVRSVDHNKVQEFSVIIRDKNELYKEAIKKNKELYNALQENRAEKEKLRKEISELRIEKKKHQGLIL